MNRAPSIGALLLGALLLVAGIGSAFTGLVLAIWSQDSGTSRYPAAEAPSAPTPDVVGKTTADAIVELRRVGVATSDIDIRRFGTDSVEPDVVAQQDPSPGTVVGGPVLLSVGFRVVKMPDVTALSVDSAIEILLEAGVPSSEISTESATSTEVEGTVVWQHPVPYYEAPYGIILGVAGP